MHPDGGVVAVVIVAIGDCPVLVHQPHTCLSAPTSQDSVTTIVAAATHITCVCTNRIRAACTSYARCSHEEACAQLRAGTTSNLHTPCSRHARTN